MNTIEEEKHETQTSNYFREGGAGHLGSAGTYVTESERDGDNATNLLGSHILDDDLINSSSKMSPHRLPEGADYDFPHSTKNQKTSSS